MSLRFGANEAEDRKRRAERDSGIPVRGMDFTPDPPLTPQEWRALRGRRPKERPLKRRRRR